MKEMNLEKLDLRSHLIRMGMPTLEEIIGKDELEAISLIANRSPNESMIADLLIDSTGNEIFSDNLLRGYVIHFLSENYKSYLEFDNPDEKLSEKQKKQLINRAWNRNFHSYQRLINIFGLSSDYLPEEAVQEKNYEILEANKNYKDKNFFLLILEKVIKFIKSFFINEKKENFGLEEFQIRIKDQLIKQITNNKLKALIHMPTGSGKTRTVLTSLIEYNLKTKFFHNNFLIWIAHSDELCDQAKDAFTELWNSYGTTDIPLIRLKNQNLEQIKSHGKGVIITTYAKLHKMRVSPEGSRILEHFRTKSKFIVSDEAHMVPAETFRDSVEFITKIDFTMLIGLSATPGGYYIDQTEVLANYFLKNKISVTDENNKNLEGDEPIKYLQKIEVLAKIKARQIATNFQFEFTQEEQDNILNTFEDLNSELIRQMGKDTERNICIFGELQSLYEKGYSTIVFACSLKHAKLLHRICTLSKMKVAKMVDTTRYQQRKKIVRDFRNGDIKIIFNYGVLSAGFDAPGTDAILIARPTTSPVLYSQMLGRGLRGPKFKGKEECLLIDIKDNLKGLPDEKLCFTLFNKYYN
jgi:superfamily II DNA or RNA helicase